MNIKFPEPGNMSQIIPEELFTIRFLDCDPLGHLNNSRYLDYFLNAREDHLLHTYNFNIYDYTKETGVSWVAAQNQIGYLLPVFVMNKVIITSRLIEYSDKHIKIEMLMMNEDKTKVMSLLWLTSVHFNIKTQKVAAHENNILKLFEALYAPVEEKSFGEREKYFRMKNKGLV